MAVDTQVIEPKLKERKRLFRERSLEFRNEITEAIRQGKEIELPRHSANGDDLLLRAALWEVLTQLCEDEGIDPSNLHITAKSDGGDNTLRERILAIFSMGAADGEVDIHWGKNQNLYKESLYQFAAAFNVTLDPSVYEEPAKLWPTDAGPLRWVDEAAISEKALQLHKEIGGKQVFVIGQSGSTAEKRFNDQQIVEVAKAVRKKNPDAYIVVLSDKHFLRAELPKLQNNNNPAFAVGGVSTKYSEAQVETFLTELATPIAPAAENGIDRVVEPTDVNELLAYFRVAEEAVMTDSYWMHLASSQEVPKVVALFTLFRPEKWMQPGTVPVRSAAIAHEKRDSISSQYYHQNAAYGEHDGLGYGIEEKDIQKLTETVAQE